MTNCPICESPDRAEIESALLSIGQTEVHTLDQIADTFDVDIKDLQKHALFHSPIAIAATDDSDTEEAPSIARQLKLREADMLAAAASEFMITLKVTGRCIRTLATEDEFSFPRRLTKPLVDLYVGTGGELRAALKTLADLKLQLDGPKADANSGIGMMFGALSKAMQDRLPPSDD